MKGRFHHYDIQINITPNGNVQVAKVIANLKASVYLVDPIRNVTEGCVSGTPCLGHRKQA
jgi:hypothetical protein